MRRKTILSRVVFTALFVSIFAGPMRAEVSADYFDYGPSFREDIETARSVGIIPESLIGTDMTKDINREQFADLVIRLYNRMNGVKFNNNVTANISATPFSDCYNLSVKKAAELGVVEAYTSNGLYRPLKSVTRQEAASMTYNLLVALGVRLSANVAFLDGLDDAEDIAAWARNTVSALLYEAYMTTTDLRKFEPKSNLTIEQAISMMTRIFLRNDKRGIEPNPITITSHTDGSFVPYGEVLVKWTRERPEPGVTYQVVRLDTSNVTNNDMYPWGYTDLPRVTNSEALIAKRNLYNNSETILAIRDSNGVYSRPVRLFIGSKGLRVLDRYNIRPDNNNNITINWNKLDDAADYSICVIEGRASGAPNMPDGDVINAKSGGKTTYTFATQPNRSYKVTIKAITSGNSGFGYSDTVMIYTVRYGNPSGDVVPGYEGDYTDKASNGGGTVSKPLSAQDIGRTTAFTDSATAERNMKTITVPVWRLSNGKKTAGKASITINKDLADDVLAIFTEIYNGDEKFPIKDVGGFAWRPKNANGTYSAHNSGWAIDINANENYCIYPNGRIVGSYWKPGVDPYSITPYGDVVKAFERHGWYWLGDTWGSVKDYMHFSYNGR